MDYNGTSTKRRMRIIAKDGWLAKYAGQVCECILYEEGVNPQLNTEQLRPPIPKWQSAKLSDLEEA